MGERIDSGRRARRALAIGVATAAAAVVPAAPAQAIHLFPLTPGFDPVGHDCAQALEQAPEAQSAATVATVGFNFLDEASRSSTTTIAAGESVTWRWLADHCHSVTFSDGSGTAGAPGFQPAEPELVRFGAGDTYTVTFEDPGTYGYLCVHHAAVGMQGTIVVE
jgi:plastocyanin